MGTKTKLSSSTRNRIADGFKPPCDLCGQPLEIGNKQEGATGGYGFSYRCTNNTCTLQPGFAHVPWFTVILKALLKKTVVISVGAIGFITVGWLMNTFTHQPTQLSNQQSSQVILDDQEKQLLDYYRKYKDTDNLLVHFGLLDFEKSQDGTQISYYSFMSLSKLIDQDTDIDLLRRFLRAVAKHPRTYESSEYKRPTDLGFHRHFILAGIFYTISLNSDVADPSAENAKRWALLYFIRYLGNVKKTIWIKNDYPWDIEYGVKKSKKFVLELLDEMTLSNDNVVRQIRTAIAKEDFNTLFDIYKKGVAGNPPLKEILGKDELYNDQLWTQ